MSAEVARPLAAKLGIGPRTTVALVGAPRGWSVPELPEGARVRRGFGSGAEVVLLFVRAARARDQVLDLAPRLDDLAALWVLWPRRAAGHDSDVTDELVRSTTLPTGLVDVKVAAVGEDWSGLRFVRRKELRRR